MGAEPRDFVPLRGVAGFAVQPFVAGVLGYLTAPMIEGNSRLVTGAVADDMRQVAISLAGEAASVFWVISIRGTRLAGHVRRPMP